MDSSPRLSRASRRRTLLAVAALGLVSACGNGNAPGVSVTNAQSDVVFGNPVASSSPVGTPNGQQFVPQGPGLGFPTQPTLPGLTLNTPPPFHFPDNPQPVSTPFCPGPRLGASAPSAATTSVQGQPATGFYLWQLLTSEQIAPKIVKKTALYTNDEIRNVSAVTSTPNPQGGQTTTFTYDQVALGKGGSTLTTTYQVKQNAPGVNVGQVENIGTPHRVSAPDAGVAIKAEVARDATGKVIGSFQPVTAVLILPLPIVGGATFNGAGTDPTTGGSMSVQGTVKGPDRVVGCTDFVQGYRVDATVTSSGSQAEAGPTVNQTYVIETQAGALVVGNTQMASGSKITTSSVIGDLNPSKSPTKIPKDLQP